MRIGQIARKTTETDIKVKVNLDGEGKYNIKTPNPFLNHMLEQLAKHSLMDIEVDAQGDTEIDYHHLTEDMAICLGQAVCEALGDKLGIERYGHSYIPMDETLTRAVIDLCGRPYTVWDVKFTQDRLGGLDTELFREWFIAFANNAKCNLHITTFHGVNNHHIAESCFKALAVALRQAIMKNPRKSSAIPSTKGVL